MRGKGERRRGRPLEHDTVLSKQRDLVGLTPGSRDKWIQEDSANESADLSPRTFVSLVARQFPRTPIPTLKSYGPWKYERGGLFLRRNDRYINMGMSGGSGTMSGIVAGLG